MPLKNKERIERIMLFLITKTKVKFYNHEQKYNHRRAVQSINPIPCKGRGHR